MSAFEATVTYTLEHWGKTDKSFKEGIWLTRVVLNGERVIEKTPVALFNLDSEVTKFAPWFHEMKQKAGAALPVSINLVWLCNDVERAKPR